MMNNKILAAAVAAALTAPGLALAQAPGTNVQIYGTLDVRLDYMKLTSNPAGTISSLSKYHLSGGQPNKIGFRGTEALGSGMTAFFQVETQLFPDARQDLSAAQVTNATLGGRPTFLGMRTAWGEVSAGYQDSPYKDAEFAGWAVKPTNTMTGAIMGNGNTTGTMPTPSCADLTSPASSAAGINNVSTVAPAAGASGVKAPVITGFSRTAATPVVGAQGCNDNAGSPTSFNRTVSNSIMYRSPVIAGFSFAAMTAANEWKEPTSATPAGENTLNPTFGAYSLKWAAGPFSVAGGYEVHNGFRAVNTGTAAAPTNRAAKDTGVAIGGRYNYGRGLIGLGYEQLKYKNSAADTAAASNGFTLKNWAVEATFNVTPADVLWGGYSRTNGKTSCDSGIAATCGSDSGAKFYTFGVDHNFSKRTAVYAYYSKIDNNALASYNYISDSRTTNAAAGAGAGLGAGVDSTSYNIGMKHTF